MRFSAQQKRFAHTRRRLLGRRTCVLNCTSSKRSAFDPNSLSHTWTTLALKNQVDEFDHWKEPSSTGPAHTNSEDARRPSPACRTAGCYSAQQVVGRPQSAGPLVLS